MPPPERRSAPRDGHFVRAAQLAKDGRVAEAIEAYQRGLAAQPDFAPARNNLGNLLTGSGRTDEAIVELRRAIELDPGYALAHYNLGNALRRAGQQAEGIASYRKALELRPQYPEALNNLGNALNEADRLPEAAEVLERAVAARPGFGEALNNLATVQKELGLIEESLDNFARAVSAAPQLADASFGYALALLLAGRYREGWQHYESRWACNEFTGRRRHLTDPLWRGENFAGKTLLVYFEQGFGDTLQLLRYLPMVAARGGKVVLEVQRPLLRLCAGYTRWAQLIAGGEPRPRYDLQCPLLSLPLAFDTTLESIPREVPYLQPDPWLVAKWRERLATARPGLRVGLVWAGNPKQKSEPKRGIGLEPCLPLFSLPGVRWFGLQVGERAGDVVMAPPGSIRDLSPELTDFAETAAAIANLDLVISSDTAVVHLAGALGHPTWALLRFSPDWRWHLGRDDCPWYPAMRLFRQPRRDDWPAVIAAVRGALAERVRG
jgi:Tfp pilus assembly protein PilF